MHRNLPFRCQGRGVCSTAGPFILSCFHAAGETDAALVVGSLYDALARAGVVTIPTERRVPEELLAVPEPPAPEPLAIAPRMPASRIRVSSPYSEPPLLSCSLIAALSQRFPVGVCR